MLATPTTSTTRFCRTLFDVDRNKPSPFGWKPCPRRARSYVRRMGLVESFFNTMATLHEGRTDIFYRVPLSCPLEAYEQLKSRLPLVWALLCRRHPLLAAWVETLTPDGTSLDPQEASARRQKGEATQDASSSFEPHFLFNVPETASGLLDTASRRVVILPDDWSVDPQISSAAASRDDNVLAWLDHYVWNHERRFLQQHAPFGLARLILLPPTSSISTDGQVSFDLVLCTAHCISDGLSVSSLVGELLQILTSPQLPSNLPELSLEAKTSTSVPGATLPLYTSVTADIKQVIRSGLFSGSQSNGSAQKDDRMSEGDFVSLLPPSIEATYPELLPLAPPAQLEESRVSASRLARTRWFWTIRRVILQNRSAKAESAILSDFKADRTDRSVKEPWWGAQTRWSVVRLSREDTAGLTQLAKRKGVRVGSLLYAASAFALNTLENAYLPKENRDEQPTTTVMGFPFSVRRFLDSLSPVDALRPAGASDPLLPPSSLGVKLGFNGVALPPAALFSLPVIPQDGAQQLTTFQRAQLWQTARQVQRQFNAIFAEPRFMHADGFLMGLERETRFRQNGVKDVFQVIKDDDADAEAKAAVAGADERKPGLTKKNMQGPGSSLNFSMVGLLDPVLPSSFDLPFEDAKGTLQVGDDLMFGVRTRAGEAFGTSFTFRGQLNLELGHDRVVWDTDRVMQYLEIMKHVIEDLIAPGKAK